MKKILGGVVMVLLGSAAFAGMRSTAEVYINQTSKYAQGSLGSARNSADSNQYIGCSVTNDYIYCSARNAAGTWVHCDAYSASMALSARGIGSSGYLSFSWLGSSTSGTCNTLTVSHNSAYAPKEP